jgi:hypothetical protein
MVHSQQHANLQILRCLGEAAKHGKDALVSVAYTLPNPSPKFTGPDVLHGTVRRNIGTARPLEIAKVLQRQHLLAERRKLP